jgi:hypothetical protein
MLKEEKLGLHKYGKPGKEIEKLNNVVHLGNFC